MKERRRIEREFGVLRYRRNPGWSLDSATGWKRLPENGPLDTEAALYPVSARSSSIWAAAMGDIPSAARVAARFRPSRCRYSAFGAAAYATPGRINTQPEANVRFAACDGLTFVQKYLSPRSVRELHCYHPQPYHDPRESQRRLLTPTFLALAHQSLDAEGCFFVQTDNPGYWRYILEAVPAFFDFQERDELARRTPGAHAAGDYRQLAAACRYFAGRAANASI